MASTVPAAAAGEYVDGVYVEPYHYRCFDCPFDDCSDANAESIKCPRRAAEIEHLHAVGVIPYGYITAEELAEILGVSMRNIPTQVRRLGIPTKLHQVGGHRWRIYRRVDVETRLMFEPLSESLTRLGDAIAVLDEIERGE